MAMDNTTLIAECVKGDAKAQKALFDKYASKMLAVCMRYFPSQMEAEDVLQDGFVKVFSHIDKYDDRGSFEGWMRRVFVNTALDELRKRKMAFTEEDISEIPYRIEHASKGTDEEIIAEDLMKLIRTMPEGYRVVFNLFAIEGYSHKEIAQQLQIEESTSKSQYFRARAFLRQQLEKLNIGR